MKKLFGALSNPYLYRCAFGIAFSGFQKADSTQPLVKAAGTKFRSYFLRGQEFPFPIYKYYYMYMQKSERHKEDAYA